MSYKVTNEIINKNYGYCIVTIQTKEGKFYGLSLCHEDDSFSYLAGARYAEKRAVASWAKYKAKLAKIQLQTIDRLIKDIQYQDLPVPRYIKLKVRDYSEDIEHWQKVAEDLEKSILIEDKARVDILKRYSSLK